jgi:hypothetical protein
VAADRFPNPVLELRPTGRVRLLASGAERSALVVPPAARPAALEPMYPSRLRHFAWASLADGGWTLTGIAEVVGVSRQAVSQGVRRWREHA